jgi:hypothetical protein
MPFSSLMGALVLLAAYAAADEVPTSSPDPTSLAALGLARGKCGMHELAAGVPLQGGAWRPRTTATYTPHCPYLQGKVRYNCVGKSTTANDFEFQFGPSQCSVRSIHASLHVLAGDHLHVCGDSHAKQVFLLEILCSDAGRIRRYNGAPPPDPAGWPTSGSDNSDTCATARHYYPPTQLLGCGPCPAEGHVLGRAKARATTRTRRRPQPLHCRA